MSELTTLLNRYISKDRGFYYYHIELGNNTIHGGYFHKKSDCRKHMRGALREYLPDYTVACEFFRMRHR